MQKKALRKSDFMKLTLGLDEMILRSPNSMLQIFKTGWHPCLCCHLIKKKFEIKLTNMQISPKRFHRRLNITRAKTMMIYVMPFSTNLT